MGRHSRESEDEAVVGVETLTADRPDDVAAAEVDASADSPADIAADAPKASRAGRDLRSAIGVGVGLAAAIVASLLIYRPSFVVVILIAVVIGVYELATAVAARPPLLPLLAGAIAMDAAAWFRGTGGLVIGLLITVCAVAVWRLGDGVADYLRDLSTSALIALYVPLLAGFAVLLAHPSDGLARVLVFIGLVVCSDTGGYATGVLLGRHPLAPRVSKGKTWEGFAGSLATCALTGFLVIDLTFHHVWWKGVLLGLAMAVTATLGDLGESMIKRDIGIKDMGSLLPGHGGIMDRLDSLLPCAAVAYVLLSWIAPT